MDNLQKRIFLFLLGCMGVRSFLVYFTKHSNQLQLKYGAVLATIIAASWIYLYYFDLRKTGSEVFGGKIWWNKLRPIHALLYLTFAITAISNNYMYAWIILLLDVLLGFISFACFHLNTLTF